MAVNIDQIQRGFLAEIKRWAGRSLRHVLNDVRLNLTGRVLNVRSGQLRKSIGPNSGILPEGDGFFIGTNVFYGRAWELGFERKAYTIVPVKKKALRWIDQITGDPIFARRAKMPRKRFAARPFLAPALSDNAIFLKNDLDQSLTRAAERYFPDIRIEVRL